MKNHHSASSRLITCLAFFTIALPATALAATPQISVGESHTVGLDSSGNVWTWGSNGYGQLCGTRADNSIPTQVAGVSDVVAVAASARGTFAVTSTGALYACGYNQYGELGLGSAGGYGSIVSTITASTVMDGSSTAAAVDTTLGEAALGAGLFHLLVVNQDGNVIGFGKNGEGQLGDGNTADSATGVTVSGLTNPLEVTAGDLYSAALTSGNTVAVWGKNSSGFLGLGHSNVTLTPSVISGLTGVQTVDAGPSHTIALTSGGTVYAWGENTYGQLGDGTLNDKLTPTAVSGLPTTIADVNTSAIGSQVLETDGTTWLWGKDGPKILGDGSTSLFDSRGTLGQSDDGSSVVDQSSPYDGANWGSSNSCIEGGTLHTVALQSDGTILTSGENTVDQLGDYTLVADFRTSPDYVLADTGFALTLADICVGPDTDLDGVADVCDVCPGFDDTADADVDTIPDGCDTCTADWPILIGATAYYAGGIQFVYDNNALSLDVIQVQTGYSEDILGNGSLTLDQAIDITIEGGNDCAFTSNSGAPTEIVGTITIGSNSGAVELDNIAIL